jgi:hypothetical protein
VNYFAHGRRFIDDPYFLAGTAVPDWLNVVDRQVRVRGRHAAVYANPDPAVGGIGLALHSTITTMPGSTRRRPSPSWRLTRIRDAPARRRTAAELSRSHSG